jgi:sirohydrochlorin ferrochelatase
MIGTVPGATCAASADSAHRHLGLIIVDHGSQRADANRMLEDLVALFAASTPFAIVEPAHMELAEPTLTQAFDRCVERGARLVVVHPYFLLPGRHWEEDIPAITAAAAARHPRVQYLVTEPLGLHPRLIDVITDRIQQCLQHAEGKTTACEK